VRELKNMMEQIVILNDDETVKPKHLPERLIKQKEEKEVTEILDLNSLKRKKELMIDELERKEICAALAYFNGNRTKAARYLKISTRSLQLKIKKLNITEKDYGML
jgi:DNA-binding NtrC family response regulator